MISSRPIICILYISGSQCRLVSSTQVRCHLILMMPGPGSHNLRMETNKPLQPQPAPAVTPLVLSTISNTMQNRKQPHCGSSYIIPAQNCHKMNSRLNISHYPGSVEQETRGGGSTDTHNNVLRLINGVLQSVRTGRHCVNNVG